MKKFCSPEVSLTKQKMKFRSPLKCCQYATCSYNAVNHEFSGIEPVEKTACRMKQQNLISEQEFLQILNADKAFREEESRYLLRSKRPTPIKLSNNIKNVEIYYENRDPITLEELGEHTFKFERHNAVVTYNVESLVNYLLHTRCLVEPTTRATFNSSDLIEIDKSAKLAGLNFPSVLDILETAASERQRVIQQQNLLDGADRCLGEIVGEMLKVIELSSPEAEITILSLFSQFQNIFDELHSLDGEFCMQCLRSYKELIQGPPNHPTPDPNRLLRAVVRFFDELESKDFSEGMASNLQP